MLNAPLAGQKKKSTLERARNTNKETETQTSKQLSRIANKQAETKPTKRGAMSIPIKTEDTVIDRGLTSAEISEGGGGALNGVDA